jgi:hypothetical protein
MSRAVVFTALVSARADAQQAFLDGGDEVAAELVSGDSALSAATETDGVWSLNAGEASVGLVLDASPPTEAWGDATLAGWDRPEIAEWVTAARNGIEHAMLVEAPVVPGNEQRLTVLTAGLQPFLFDSANVLLSDEKGVPVIVYGGLFAFDADAQEVPTWFEVVGSEIVIAFDDADATYPILIDPLATASTNLGGVAHQTTQATTGRGQFGWTVASGDIDRNGYDDVVVGIPEACSSATEGATACQVKEGLIKVYFGYASGLATTASTLDSDIAGAEMGRSLAVGDVDGDGCADIVAGAPGGEVGGETDEGVVVVFRSRYCQPTNPTGFFPQVTLDSNEGFSKMGTSVAVAKTTSGPRKNGHIYAVGDNTRALWEFKFDNTTSTFTRTMRTFGSASAPIIPVAVVAVKDIDRDGDDELAVSFPHAFRAATTFPVSPALYGWVNVYRGLGGAAGGINTASLGTTLACPTDNQFPGCGHTITSADVNGDDRGDIIVANRSGYVWLDVWTATAAGNFTSAPQQHLLTSQFANIEMKHAVGSVRDLNLDTYEDIVFCSAIVGSNGTCTTYSGSASGNLVFRGSQPVSKELHHGIIAGGFTRNDPATATGNRGSEVVLGLADTGTVEGAVLMFNGTPAGPQLAVSSSQSVVNGNAANDKLGRRVLLSDLNDDGRDDLIVSSPDSQQVRWWFADASGNFATTSSGSSRSLIPNDRFGESIATIKVPGIPGRFIAIGAPGRCGNIQPNGTCTMPNAGHIQIFSIFGPASWYSDIPGNPFGAEARLGSSLANIGNAYNTADGLAASTRTSTTPVALFKYNPTAGRYNLENTIGDFCTGGSRRSDPLALAGVDMNNDGITDVIVGDAGCTPANSADGAVFGFAGGGTYTSPIFQLFGAGKSEFGYSLAPAGDVDRDGRADLLVGAPSEISGPIAAGAVHVYRGTTSTPTLLHTVRGNVGLSRFGEAVAGGRDVNFDGFADFVVGIPNLSAGTGNALVYRGTSSGPKLLTGCSELSAAGLGLSVAMGNVNNDTYGDVACGAQGVGTPASAGRVAVFRGIW